MPGTYTVLIADDEPHIRAVVGTKLRGAGLVVFEARDGRESLELAKLRHPHLVVTDLQMPTLSGLEFAIELRAHPATSQIPVLMLTARGHIVPAHEIARTNIKELIAKPFSARSLLEKALVLLESGGEAENHLAA